MIGSSRPPRSAALDAIRVLAILAVLAGHLPYRPPWLPPTVYAWHVPVFFLLTGYLWRYGRPAGDEINRRWLSIGRPYVTWLALLGVPFLVIGCLILNEYEFVDQVRRTLTLVGANRLFTTFWFLAALFFAAILARLLEPAPRSAAWALGLLGLVAGYLTGKSLSSLPLWIGLALPSLFFILVGQELKRFRERIPVPLVTGLLAIAAGAALVATGLAETVDMKYARLGTPVLGVLVAVLIGAGLVLVAEVLTPAVPAVIQRFVIAVAQSGLVVVLIHPAIIWGLSTWTDLRMPFFYTALVVLSWSIAYTLSRVPGLAGWLVGVDRPRGGTPAPVPAARTKPASETGSETAPETAPAADAVLARRSD
ncbi:fucose 4-O-acetylase-like acetyltransferase [Actinoplanes lutulentus]|uniref:acyltransferase family protein n=1 Tax=Actinoplanes lutulentus TaxID=1287878 RepID=UPI0011B9416B|nr:acyltransferase family protein [Actinoplanes lutulentus]MBB2941790.1 fucose 4-O-acetylase-like acetyltransferase [Actinoplanes lutulentus]